ncbi:M56 family metallopeptidase [Aurantiacibacter sp. MUD61]|uniref:M56 family metallopeptidase n=1 Tax=Aurantiacibacter sp. MUD61 TaxID=3009083 RepID=UPI0022EFF108|nr:M56 family metallopeptidase [Aurantiacibacter sp. MUD61]
MSLLGGAAMSDWMVDTFIYTALLIGLVLLVRRPVMRQFGPQVAYALWALPLLRFIMPPIILPAWMAPAPEPVATADPVAAGSENIMFILPDGAAGDAAATLATDASVATADTSGFFGTDLLLPIWIVGAVVFLGWRIREYRRMRRDLLADARPMGESGNIRLVETPAVSAPVAFGVRDKVVALPVDFMTLLDVNARDMAIAHELEHHRGHDLLANIAAQPLLALHWFNPLAWWGWRAMRRDQEAACDARVVAGRAQSERAAYAKVIAGFAAGEHLALAAPMACPVLGEKSIIHRLRSLTMSDISSTRRKLGIAAITTTALALPLTASISYAAPDEAEQDRDPIETVDPDEDQQVYVDEDTDVWVDQDEDPLVEVVQDGERHVIVHRITEPDGEERVVRRVIRMGDGEGHDLSEEEMAQIMAEVEAELAEVDMELAELDLEIAEHVEMAMAYAAEAREMAGGVVVVREGNGQSFNLSCDGREPVVERELADGRTAIMVCRSQIRSSAIGGIEEAIAEIANDPDIPEEMRTRIMRQLEATIVRMREQQASVSVAPRSMVKPARARALPVARARGGVSAAAATVRPVSMVSPITGEAFVAPHDEDCEHPATA